MLRYPQLSTGAVAQFPFRRMAHFRTTTNELLNGESISYSDDGAESTSWQLSYTGLSDVERSALESLFVACEGRLTPFLFADPSGNLLLWSEKLDQAVWSRSPYLQVQAGVANPQGKLVASRLTNAAQVAQSISQDLVDVSSCDVQFSVWVRSSSPVAVSISLTGAGMTVTATGVARSAWSQIGCSGHAGTSGTPGCSLSLPAGAVVDVYAFQANLGVNPTPYRATRERGAMYAKTFFSQDQLLVQSDGLDSSSANVSLVSYHERTL